MTHLFVYGSLMYESVWQRLVSSRHRKIRARLSGYRRFRIRGQDFPGIIKSEGHVDGIVYFDLDDKTIRRLDEFEAECYYRTSEQVTDTSGRVFDADTYVVQNAYRSWLDDTEWDQAKFERSGLQRFLTRYHGFDDE